MELSLRVDTGQATAGIAGLAERITAAATQSVTLAAHLVERHTKDQLRTSSHPAKTPTPSTPGEPPSLVTGNLMRSVSVTSFGESALVGPTAIYGRIQELGGAAGRGHHVHLPARPYLKPGTQDAIPDIEALVFANISAALGG